MLAIQRDPLFGVLIILAIIALVALADFWRMRLAKKNRNKSLLNLAHNYNFKGIDQDLEKSLEMGVDMLLKRGKNAILALSFVAQSFERSGEIQEAIKIYLHILEHTKTPTEKMPILEALGKAYFKAGFLQRAKHIFLETLKAQPRNGEILMYLMRTYESLGEHLNALDAIECIEELDRLNQNNDPLFLKEMNLNKLYLKIAHKTSSLDSSIAQNVQNFLEYKNLDSRLMRPVFKYIKTYSTQIFWEEIEKLDAQNIKELLDILWYCQEDEIPIQKIENKFILEIFLSKGYFKDSQKMKNLASCSNFVLEQKRLLDKYSNFKSNLNFEYRCNGCKNKFPFDNERCSVCGELLNFGLIINLKKISSIEN